MNIQLDKYSVKREEGKYSGTWNNRPYPRNLNGDLLVIEMFKRIESLENSGETTQEYNETSLVNGLQQQIIKLQRELEKSKDECDRMKFTNV